MRGANAALLVARRVFRGDGWSGGRAFVLGAGWSRGVHDALLLLAACSAESMRSNAKAMTVGQVCTAVRVS